MMTPNLNYIFEIAGDDIAFQNKMFEVIKSEFLTERKLFYDAFFNDDLEDASAMVHKIKFKINILGMTDVIKIADDFELDLKKNKTELYTQFDQILKVITTFIENHKEN